MWYHMTEVYNLIEMLCSVIGTCGVTCLKTTVFRNDTQCSLYLWHHISEDCNFHFFYQISCLSNVTWVISLQSVHYNSFLVGLGGGEGGVGVDWIDLAQNDR